MNKILDIFFWSTILFLLYYWFGEFSPIIIVLMVVGYCFWSMISEDDKEN